MFATLLLVLAAQPTAPAAPGLTWDAPAACPSAAEVHERLGHRDLGALSVVASVTSPSGDVPRWTMQLRLSWEGVEQVRSLDAEGCDALVEALLALVDVQLDEIAQSVPEPEPTPPQDPAPSDPVQPAPEESATPDDTADRPSPAPPAPSQAEDPPRTPRRPELPLGLRLGLGVGLGLGATPDPGVPVAAHVGGSLPRLRIGAWGRWWIPRPVDPVRIQLGTAGVELCPRFGLGAIELLPCARGAVGASRAAPVGAGARLRRGLWAEAGVSVGVRWSLRPRIALSADLAADVPLQTTRYALHGADLFEPWPVVPSLVIGMEFHPTFRNRPRPEKE